MKYSGLAPALVLLVSSSASFAGHELEDRDFIIGQTVYAEQCASCHGVNLEGQPNWRTPSEDGILPAPPHDETGHTWHHDNQLLFDYTKLGGDGIFKARGITGVQSGMPAFDDVLGDDDIWNVLAYIRSTWPEEVQDIQAARNPPHE